MRHICSFILICIVARYLWSSTFNGKSKTKNYLDASISIESRNGFMIGVAPAMNWQMGSKPASTSFNTLGSVDLYN